MQIKNHLLSDTKVRIGDSPNQGGTIKPTVIVLHYTASGGEDGSGDASYLSRATSRASAHVVVGRDGSIDQIVPFNKRAWHAGKSSHNGVKDVNDFSIGIEIDNWGWLDDDHRSHTGATVDAKNVFIGQRDGKGHKHWEAYRLSQLDAVEEVIAAIIQAYPIKDIVGHEDIAPGRKQDPGPALDKFKAQMKAKYLNAKAPAPAPTPTKTEKAPTKGTKKVTANGLRLRSRPNYSSVILTHLYEGNEVIELKRDVYPGWSQVQFGKKIGYVANQYLD